MMDFEKFCADYGVISDKASGEKTSLKLNGAQRCVLEHLEKCRMGNLPCRLLILKSRQLGISTLLQYYFTWLLLFHCEMETFLSLCHNKQLSKSFVSNMKDIYVRYDKDSKLQKVSDNVWQAPNGNNIIFGSAKTYNSMRGYNIGIAHLSESAFWHSNTSDWSEGVIRGVMGSVGNRGGTFVVMESTSDGRNNFFYKLWRDSVAGMTSYHPLFLSWNLCEYYSRALSESDRQELKTLSSREQSLVASGYSLEQINWYRHKRKEFQEDSSFLREFPCSAEESFEMSSKRVFGDEEIAYYKAHVKDGSLVDLSTRDDGTLLCHPGGSFTQWNDVENDRHRVRYFVVVAIGGTVDQSRYNVISCWSLRDCVELELCLERRYVCDIDTLIDDSIKTCRYYNNAKLIVEVNSLNRMGMSSKDYYIRKLTHRYPRLFVQDGNIGYSISRMRKLRGLLAFRRRLREGLVMDYSRDMLAEMEDFVMEDEELCASHDSHDDVLLCRLILNDVLDEIGPFTPVIKVEEMIKSNYRPLL